MPSKEDDLLKEIRDRFEYCVNSWKDIRAESKEDRRYLSGDPWPPDEKLKRQTTGQERPCIATDELNQYVNTLVNDVRQNKRAIKIIPKGDGATDQTAEDRSDLIRQIEYRSNAQSAYCTAFEQMVEGSYGAFKITKGYSSPESFEQELRISPIRNQDAIYIDPDCKEPDRSDMNYGFELAWIQHDEFRREFGEKVRITDFSAEMISSHPSWIRESQVQIASYWRKETRKRMLMLLDGGEHGPIKLFADELDGDLNKKAMTFDSSKEKWKILKLRETQFPKVVQYVTNGVEILDTIPWDGKYIPIVPIFGKEMYTDSGAGSQLVISSLVRLARDPYMLLCYCRTSQLELAAAAPKTVYVGYEGQFENHEDEWKVANRSPTPYLQVKPVTDPSTGQLLPFPQRNDYNPPIQSLEVLAEAARRGIQAAMGIAGLPTAAQRNNEKSGVALQRIQSQAAQGSFHFIDNYNRALELAGRIIDDLLDVTYDTARDVGARNAAGDHRVMRINDPNHVDPKTGKAAFAPMTIGDHDVTVSTGPSYDSQRDEAQEFATAMAGNPTLVQMALAQPQSSAAKILALVIKLKDLGPLGDQMAQDISPQQDQAPIPPQVQQALQQLQQQLVASQATIKELAAQLAEAKNVLSKAAMDNASKERMKAAEIQKDLAVAALGAKSEETQQLVTLTEQRITQMLEQAHEASMQATGQAHEAEQAKLNPPGGGSPSGDGNAPQP